MPSLQTAYNFIVQKCDDPNVGYSQGELRYGVWQDGRQYYDCSSLISAALTEGGFFETNPWFTTFNMDEGANYMYSAGFHSENVYGEWKNGDVLVRHEWGKYGGEHTEMVYDGENKFTMGAHTDKYDFVDQVSYNSFPSSGDYWDNLLRYDEDVSGGTSYDLDPKDLPWNNNSGYEWQYAASSEGFTRSSSQARNNACIVFWYTYNAQNSWCRNAIYALLGYMQTFSGLNPWRTITENAYLDNDPIYGVVPWPIKSTLTYEAMTVYGTSVPNTSDGDVQMNTFMAEYLNMNYRNGDTPQYEGWGNDNYPIQYHQVWEWHDPTKWELCTNENTPKLNGGWVEWATDNTVDIYTKARQFMVYYGLAGVDLSQCKAGVTEYIDSLSENEITISMSRLEDVYDNTLYWSEELANFIPNGGGSQGNGSANGEQDNEEIVTKKYYISRPKLNIRIF